MLFKPVKNDLKENKIQSNKAELVRILHHACNKDKINLLSFSKQLPFCALEIPCKTKYFFQLVGKHQKLNASHIKLCLVFRVHQRQALLPLRLSQLMYFPPSYNFAEETVVLPEVPHTISDSRVLSGAESPTCLDD